MIVLDASVAVAWCFADEQGDLAERVLTALQSDSAIAPSLWPFEVGNALLAAERRGRLAAGERPHLMELLNALPIELDAVTLPQVLVPVTEIARAHGLSIYDASYLELAHRLKVPLATLDKRLAEAAEAFAVERYL